mmetsp:Transcript_88045/g.188938  ORF Transcript_88045/g.188938 Transcript_88045/m.188938 type:complete len:269 (+) Transcript_88045:1322-2128(+)
MLHDNDVVVHNLESADHLGGSNALTHVEVGRGLVEHVHSSILDAEDCNREALQLTSGQVLDLPLLQVVELQLGAILLAHTPLVLFREDITHLPSNLLRDLVDILRLDHRLETVLEEPLDVPLQLAAPEVTQDFLPVGRVVEPPKIGLQLPRQDIERSGLADPVRAHQAQDLAWPRNRQPVQLEGVRTIPVRGLLAEVLRKVDDGDRLEGALLGADTATNAERLRDPGEFGVFLHLDAELACSHHGAELLALLLALFRLATVRVHDGNS